jgi:hypothetical protein
LLATASDVPAGLVTVSVNRLGRFSLNLLIGQRSFPLTGSLDAKGSFVGKIRQPGFTSMPVTLKLDFSSAEPQFSGTIVVDGTTLNVGAVRSQSATLAAGSYTLALPADTQRTDPLHYPFGHGYSLVRVKSSGRVRVRGRLGDGQPFSAGGVLDLGYRLTVHTTPYAKRGLLEGTLTFVGQTSAGIDEIEGTLNWERPTADSGAYAAGFSGSINVAGSRYTPPAPNTAALAIADWNLVLGANVFANPTTAQATLDWRNRFTLADSTSSWLTLTLDPATGLLEGEFKPDGGRESVTFKGVLLLRQQVGRGVLSLPDRTGPLTLDPPPVP